MLKTTVTSLILLIISLYLLFSCQSGTSVETMQYATNGQVIYTKNCQNCHGENGEGLGKLYPPLNDTVFLSVNRDKLACIVKNGISGELIINGISYNQKMPGNPSLTSIDIAYVLTYITTTFGNSKTHFSKQQIDEFLKRCN